MANLKSDKDVWMNKLRQTKEYQNTKGNELWPVQKVLAQQIDEEMNPSKYDGDVNKEEMNPSKYTKNELEQAKELIINKVVKHLDDVIFEMVCEEMSDNYLFQSDNYLTEAGYDIFEDEWFEFYHEHHGDILYQLRQTVFE